MTLSKRRVRMSGRQDILDTEPARVIRGGCEDAREGLAAVLTAPSEVEVSDGPGNSAQPPIDHACSV